MRILILVTSLIGLTACAHGGSYGPDPYVIQGITQGMSNYQAPNFMQQFQPQQQRVKANCNTYYYGSMAQTQCY